MGLSRRKFTREFKEAAVRRLELGASVAEVAPACEVDPNVLHRWRREVRDFGGKRLLRAGRSRRRTSRVAALERKVGQQALEIDFLRGCLPNMSKSSGSCKHSLPAARLSALGKANEIGDSAPVRETVPVGPGRAGRVSIVGETPRPRSAARMWRYAMPSSGSR